MTDVEKMRLFVAVSLPHEVLEAVNGSVESLRSQLTNARWTSAESQHLTMKFLGWTPSDRLAEVARICSMVAASRQPATISLTELGAFPSRNRVRVLWMGVDDPTGVLTELAADLDGAFESLGFPSEGRAYTPHLTLARFKLPVPLKSGFPELAAPPHPPIPVEGFELFRSHLSPKGARYEVIKSFPLGSGR